MTNQAGAHSAATPPPAVTAPSLRCLPARCGVWLRPAGAAAPEQAALAVEPTGWGGGARGRRGAARVPRVSVAKREIRWTWKQARRGRRSNQARRTPAQWTMVDNERQAVPFRAGADVVVRAFIRNDMHGVSVRCSGACVTRPLKGPATGNPSRRRIGASLGGWHSGSRLQCRVMGLPWQAIHCRASMCGQPYQKACQLWRLTSHALLYFIIVIRQTFWGFVSLKRE